MEIQVGEGVFCLGHPGTLWQEGSLVIQEIEVGGGLKNDPIRREGVDIFWITQSKLFRYCEKCLCEYLLVQNGKRIGFYSRSEFQVFSLISGHYNCIPL